MNKKISRDIALKAASSSNVALQNDVNVLINLLGPVSDPTMSLADQSKEMVGRFNAYEAAKLAERQSVMQIHNGIMTDIPLTPDERQAKLDRQKPWIAKFNTLPNSVYCGTKKCSTDILGDIRPYCIDATTKKPVGFFKNIAQPSDYIPDGYMEGYEKTQTGKFCDYKTIYTKKTLPQNLNSETMTNEFDEFDNQMFGLDEFDITKPSYNMNLIYMIMVLFIVVLSVTLYYIRKRITGGDIDVYGY
jgi:hypothetical protein